MKKLILIVLSFSFVCSYSQNRTIDSLKSVLKTCKEDTNKVITLNALSEKYNAAFKLDSAQYFVDQSDVLATKIRYNKGLGIAKSIKGNILTNRGQFKEALNPYKESIVLFEKVGEKYRLASAITNLGGLYIRMGDFKSAYENLEKSISLFKELNNKQGLANAYGNIGSAYLSQGNYKMSTEYLESALKLHRELKNKPSEANCINNIGLMAQYQGQYDLALEKHNEALKIREEIGDKNAISMSCLNIGIINYYKSEHQKAILAFKKSAKMAEESGNKAIYSNALNNLATAYTEQGDYANGLKTMTDVYKLKEKMNDKVGAGMALMGIGNVYLRQGKHYEALNYYNQSSKVHKEIGDKKNLANVYHNTGVLIQFQGNYPLALQNYNESIKLKLEINDKNGLIQSYNNIGTIYYYQGNYTDAVKNWDIAIGLSEEIGDKKGVTVNLNNTGMLFKEKGNYEEAIKHYKKALVIKETLGDKEGIALTHINLGDVYRLQKKHNEAASAFNEALKLSEELGHKQLKSTSIVNLGIVNYELGNITESKSYCSQSSQLAKELNDPDLIKKSNLYLSKISYKENNYSESEKHMLEAINVCDKGVRINFPIMSEKEQETYFYTLQADYMTFYSLALNIHDKNPSITESVYNSSVRNKGLLLKSSSAMRNAILTSNDSALISKYQDWINFKKQIAKLYSEGKDATELESKSDAIEKELVKGSQAFSSFDKVQKITWKDVQAGLKKDEAAVEFIHFNDNLNNSSTIMYCALIIKPGNTHPEMIKLCTSKQLEEVMGKRKETDQAYINTIYGTTENPNTQLYNLIWLPLENSLKKSKTLYISPSGLLHKVAFSSISKSKNVYLCDRYNLNIQTNTGKITSPDNVTMNDKATVSIFGGINYENEKARSDSGSFLTWNYLPGTLTEAKSINNTLLKNNISASLYEDKNASEQQFKTTATKSNILHIATHGFFFPDVDEMEEQQKENEAKSNEVASRGVEYGYGVWSFVMNKNSLMRSGLVFSGANGVWNQTEQTDEEDGVLTAQEVANLDMRQTGLVVLSACETGLGDIKGSEGVYGLQRSFKMAGVKNIIMSLWQVPDAETEEFMTLFYNKLVSVKDVKKAFSETQMTMRKKYDPFFWAPFVLIE